MRLWKLCQILGKFPLVQNTVLSQKCSEMLWQCSNNKYCCNVLPMYMCLKGNLLDVTYRHVTALADYETTFPSLPPSLPYGSVGSPKLSQVSGS